jgi:thiamine biosynthesis lipoprotein
MKLDSGGIGKGYAADQALRALREAGIASALVAISGDVAASDAPSGQAGWRIQVQDRVIDLVKAAVSTSGDEFQFLEVDGVRYSHVIDPRTGIPVRNGRPVSVIAPSGMEADSRATAYSVSGAAQPILDLR